MASSPLPVGGGSSNPYGSYAEASTTSAINNKNGDDGEVPADTVFRNWSSSPTSSSSLVTPSPPTKFMTSEGEARKELLKLENETSKLNSKLYELREYGRTIRLHRLQALDALETRRVTLTEILRRMEKELNDRDVYEYSDILAEVFGERKILAHRAVGLEALLCQYMHQMLAKQHQFKIMKQAGKDIQSLYKKHRLQNKDDYYSYEALAVQCEASRMTLEAIYDDIFAAQHSLLAKLKHVESGGNMTNYSIPSPSSSSNQQTSTAADQTNQAVTSQKDGERFSTSQDDDLEDITASMNMLKTPTAPLAESTNSVLIPSFRTGQLSTPQSTSMTTTTTTTTTSSSSSIKLGNSNESNYASGKSVRERRREIEQKRLARPTPQSGGGGTYSTGMGGMESPNYARTRLRELESARMVSPSLAGATTTAEGGSDRAAARGGDGNEDGELKERRGARKVVTPA